jgi:lipopolysaccharide/colanic/teichoic acid biosynthesis glycosyltransferase
MKPPPVASFDFPEAAIVRFKTRWWERVVDLTISLSALFLLGPVFFLIAAYVKLVSNGPILFKQKRIGHGGLPFMILKFRTMHVDACTAGHENHTANLIKENAPMTKLDAHGDSRLIPFGKFIRAAGLDELPQLINVLRNEMSIVGPRPCLMTEFAEYSHREKQRFNTLPGLTGLWQVSGKNELTFEEMIHCDLNYVERKSFRLYAVIIVKTPIVLVKQVIESRRTGKLTQMPSATLQRFEKEAVGQ